MALLFPTLIFMLIFGIGLAFSHFHSKDSDERKRTIIYRYPEKIEDRDAPFPISMLLIIVGTLIWMFFYILGIGILGVKI
jgi:hypothetical protein